MPYLDDTGERDSWRAPRGKPADPGRLWQSVKWDWRWIPIAALIWGVLGAGVAFGLMQKTYRSSTALVWEPKGELRPDERTMSAEVASIKGPAAMSRVRQLLELPISLTALGRQVEYQFEPHSRFVVLISEGASPDDAVKLGRVMVRVFLELQHGFNQQRAVAAVVEREKTLATAKQKLDAARKALDAFRASSGLGQGAAGDGAPPSGMTPAMAEQYGKVQRLRDELKRVRAHSLEDPRIPALSAQLAAAEAQLAKITPRGGARAPEPVAGAPAKPDKHSALWRYLAQNDDDGDDRPGARAASDIAKGEAQRRAAELAEASSGLQQKVKEEQDKVVAAERALARARAQSSGDNDDWRVLSPPSKPSHPERGKQAVVAIAMPLTGMLVALLALLLRPLVDGRVYTAREAAYWGRLPVLASTAWPRTREMFFPLVDELGQQALGAPGCTLVVGASAAETKLAEELASWLDEGLVNSNKRGPGSASPGVKVSPGAGASGPIKPGENLAERKENGAAGAYTTGVHAWLGEVEGPALRRAARVVDRVIVLLSSGALTFSAVAELRARLGRSSGVALVVLGLSPQLLKLPDQSGEVGRFWRYVRRASARA